MGQDGRPRHSDTCSISFSRSLLDDTPPNSCETESHLSSDASLVRDRVDDEPGTGHWAVALEEIPSRDLALLALSSLEGPDNLSFLFSSAFQELLIGRKKTSIKTVCARLLHNLEQGPLMKLYWEITERLGSAGFLSGRDVLGADKTADEQLVQHVLETMKSKKHPFFAAPARADQRSGSVDGDTASSEWQQDKRQKVVE
eukprot:m51a1_g10958 hypothetical protein (200) ;mRNA; f:216339-217654